VREGEAKAPPGIDASSEKQVRQQGMKTSLIKGGDSQIKPVRRGEEGGGKRGSVLLRKEHKSHQTIRSTRGR